MSFSLSSIHWRYEMRLDHSVEPVDLRVFPGVELDVLHKLDDALAVGGEAKTGEHLGLKKFKAVCLAFLFL